MGLQFLGDNVHHISLCQDIKKCESSRGLSTDARSPPTLPDGVTPISSSQKYVDGSPQHRTKGRIPSSIFSAFLEIRSCVSSMHSHPGRGVLEGCCLFCLLSHLLGHRLRHQPVENVSNDDHPHPSIRFVQCHQSQQPDAIDHLLRNSATGQLRSHLGPTNLGLARSRGPETSGQLSCLLCCTFFLARKSG